MRVYMTEEFPDTTWEEFSESMTAQEISWLKQTTTLYGFIVGEKASLGAMGFMPGSMLSNVATVWFGLFGGAKPTRRDIRDGVYVSELMFEELPWEILQAEIRDGDYIGAKFAEFFGFAFKATLDGKHLYEREV